MDRFTTIPFLDVAVELAVTPIVEVFRSGCRYENWYFPHVQVHCTSTDSLRHAKHSLSGQRDLRHSQGTWDKILNAAYDLLLKMKARTQFSRRGRCRHEAVAPDAPLNSSDTVPACTEIQVENGPQPLWLVVVCPLTSLAHRLAWILERALCFSIMIMSF